MSQTIAHHPSTLWFCIRFVRIGVQSLTQHFEDTQKNVSLVLRLYWLCKSTMDKRTWRRVEPKTFAETHFSSLDFHSVVRQGRQRIVKHVA